MSVQRRKGRVTFSVAKRGPRASNRLGRLLPSIVLVTGTLVACSSGGIEPTSPQIPVITPKTVVDPEPTDTPAPTRKPLSISQVSLTGSVAAGDKAKVVINTATAAECVIEVTYDNGPSEASGLGSMTADGAGTVTWSWTVARNTATGTYPIDIICFKGERAGSLSLSFKVR